MPENFVISADGYADGGEPYSDDELALMNSESYETEVMPCGGMVADYS